MIPLTILTILRPSNRPDAIAQAIEEGWRQIGAGRFRRDAEVGTLLWVYHPMWPVFALVRSR